MRAPEFDELLLQLRHTDSDVRSSAAGALGALGSDGIQAIAPLYEACRDENLYVRGEAVHSLWEIAGSLWDDAESAEGWDLLEAGIPTLIALMHDPWWEVRCSAMSVLKRIGPRAAAAIPHMRALLIDDQPILTEDLQQWGMETVIRLVRESATEAIEAISRSENPERGASGDDGA